MKVVSALLLGALAVGGYAQESTMLKLVDSIDCFLCQNLRCRLVNKVIAPLNRIVHMPLPMIFFLIT